MKRLFALVLILLTTATAQAAERHSPLQIVSQSKEFGTLKVRVIIGKENKNVPDVVTLIGTQGSLHAQLKETERACAYLCGKPSGDTDTEDNTETCHYEAIYEAKTPVGRGDIMGALPMVTQIKRFEKIEPLRMPAHLPPALKGQIMGAPFNALWPAKTRLRIEGWDYDTDTLSLGYKNTTTSFAGFETLELPGCKLFAQDKFWNFSCGYVALLFDKDNLIIVSPQDYNQPAADVLASMEMKDGSVHYLLKVGMKAQTVVGLLAPDGKGGWTVHFRPRDYALIC